jgi:2-iminobutanoate/2-iminopropanoate deaminase
MAGRKHLETAHFMGRSYFIPPLPPHARRLAQTAHFCPALPSFRPPRQNRGMNELRHGTIVPLSANEKSRISTSAAPAAIGPYSQAVRIGDLVYSSGQVALDPATGSLVAGDVAEQTTRVLENLKAVLTAAGSDLSRVVKTVVFLKDMTGFAAMNAVYARYLAPEGVVAPARSTVEVARLPKDALVEIEVIASV